MKHAELRVLLVDDDVMVRTTVRAMLNEMGIMHVTEAQDGKRALIAMEDEASPIDFIISDWNMPHKSGFEFLREIRTSHPRMPFLMLTARADESSVADAKSAGVTSYLRKPFSLNELSKKIKSIFPED